MRSPSPLPTNRQRPLLRVVALVLLMLALPVSGIADEATPGVLDPVPDPPAIISQPAPEPSPTPVPPTAVPTPVPTETILPTEQPTPTQPPDPTQEPQADESPTVPGEAPPDSNDPVIGETPVPSEDEVPSTPSATEPLVDTPTPDTTPVPNTDWLTPLPSPGEMVLAPGETVLIDVTYNVTTGRAATLVHTELRRADGTPANGWALSLQPGEPPHLAATDATNATALTPGSSFDLAILIQAPPTVDEGHTVSVFISSVETNDSGDRVALTGDAPVVNLTITPSGEDDAGDAPQARVAADDVSLSCSSDGIGVAGSHGAVTVSCSWRGNDTLAERNIVLSQVSIEAPRGWTLTAPPLSGEAALILEPRSPISGGEEHVLAFTAIPDTCDTGSGTISVTSTLASGSPGDGDAIDGPSATLHVDVPLSPALPPGVDISGLAFGSSEQTDAGYAPLTGSLAITIVGATSSACASIASGWSIQVGTTGLSASGRTDASIPAESITYLGTKSVDGAPGGILPVAADMPLATGEMTTIAFGDSSIGNGRTWNALFQLSPSGDTPSGTYGGGITVMIINGP